MIAGLLLTLSLTACGPEVSVMKRTYDNDGDGYTSEVDCNDAEATFNPDAPEICDGEDNDCDGETDEEPTDGQAFYADGDGDGAGNPSAAVTACSPGDGLVADATDCDDEDADRHPGQAERCDGVDDDCDGSIDEGAIDPRTFHADADGDGYGDASLAVEECDPPEGYVADATDCDDADAAIHPGANESDCADPTDYNCDGASRYTDADHDGVPACEDCDDADAARSPALPEVCDEANADEDCDGAADDDDDATGRTFWWPDGDGDGNGDAAAPAIDACDPPPGYDDDAVDCDDRDPAVNPRATEVCNDIDDDCSGDADSDAVDRATWYADGDGDGFGDTASIACDAPAAHTAAGGDCDDSDPGVNPDATEVCGGGDEDCDGTVDERDAVGAVDWVPDADGDGYGDASAAPAPACAGAAGMVSDTTDCDDADADAHPGAIDDCEDPRDLDCDGSVAWADADGDGAAACVDCDDSDATAQDCRSCRELLDAGYSSDGLYPIDPDGAGGAAAYDAWCDMTTSAGGWTLVLDRTHADECCISPCGDQAGVPTTLSTGTLTPSIENTGMDAVRFAALLAISTEALALGAESRASCQDTPVSVSVSLALLQAASCAPLGDDLSAVPLAWDEPGCDYTDLDYEMWFGSSSLTWMTTLFDARGAWGFAASAAGFTETTKPSTLEMYVR